VLFYDEIDPDEIPGLYAQCHVGIVALDPRHKTHNIPGKFLSYMQSGLPVLASINPGNDLVELIQRSGGFAPISRLIRCWAWLMRCCGTLRMMQISAVGAKRCLPSCFRQGQRYSRL